MTHGNVPWYKRLAYRWGFRPKARGGNLLDASFFSPSLDMAFSYSDYVKAHEGKGPFQVGLEEGIAAYERDKWATPFYEADWEDEE